MKPTDFCTRPEGHRCPDFLDQCDYCKWVEAESKEIEKIIQEKKVLED